VLYVTRLIPIAFLSLFLVAAPFLKYLFRSRYSIDAQRLGELIVMASFLPFIIFKHATKSTYIPKRIVVPIIVVVILSIASALSSSYPRSAFLEIGLISSCFLIISNGAYYFFPLHNRDSMIWISSIIVISASLAIKNAMVEYFSWITQSGNDGILTTFDIAYGYSNPRFFNAVQIITLCFFPLIICSFYKSSVKKILIIISSMYLSILLMTHGRGAFISWVSVIFITHIVYRQKSVQWVKTSLIILFWGIIFYILLTQFLPKLYHHKYITNYETFWRIGQKEERLELWAICLKIMKQHPWLGVGPMGLSKREYGINGHPHNIVLQIATELGIPAAVLIIWMVFLAISAELRKSTAEPVLSIRHISTVAALLAALMYSMVSGVTIYPVGQTWFFMISGWAYANHEQLSRSIYSSRAVKIPKSVVISLVLASSAAVFQGVWPEAKNIDSALDKYCENNPVECNQRRSPRMWSVAGFTPQQPWQYPDLHQYTLLPNHNDHRSA
uniref:O-antigen ligase family protein n=3 Tax=Candidatus Ichthyocystis TaxID=2929841 RepID=UPI001F5F0874